MTDNKENKSPEQGWPKTNGMTVPEGYFENFAERMMARIPDEPVKSVMIERTRWQTLRPYVYMAAMFAGAFLMLNIFSIGAKVRPGAAEAPAAPTSELLAQVVNSNTLAYVDDYISVTDYELYDDLYESGFEIPDNY